MAGWLARPGQEAFGTLTGRMGLTGALVFNNDDDTTLAGLEHSFLMQRLRLWCDMEWRVVGSGRGTIELDHVYCSGCLH